MSQSKNSLYLTKQIRLFEQEAIDHLGSADDDLMLRAGVAALHSLKTLYPDVRNIAVFCGSGNNAGDGYVLARLAFQQGLEVVIYQHKLLDDLPPAAMNAARAAMACGVVCQSLDEPIDMDTELVVDALLGIGIKGPVYGPIANAIHLINDSGLPVLALDVPSGLDADTGEVLGVCVHAAVTVTFIAQKVGLYTCDGPQYAGKIVCHGLQVDSLVAATSPAAWVLDESVLREVMHPRPRNAHKGMFGHVLVIGGGPGMPGAVYLAALAALRVGAGSVTVALSSEHVAGVFPGLPEVMIHGVDDVEMLKPLLSKATVCVIGPGLGETQWAESLFKATMAAQLPLVMDASALRLLARHPQQDDHWILTPHPGEAAALLDCSISDVQHNRCKTAARLSQKYGGCIVLKGAGSIVHTIQNETYICTAGNPGMASAGMGDVLSGVIVGLLAQGVSLADAAKLGVFIHAKAADEAVSSQGERGLIATDLMPYLRRQINKF